nr:hypothetical protein [uncultured bacterium]
MRDRSRIQGRCPTCGPLTLLPRDFVCALPDDPESKALTEFHCPVCDGAVFTAVTQQEAKLLMLLGAARSTRPLPLELTEEKAGPPVTVDDVFDVHVALEAMCCPQAELTE